MEYVTVFDLTSAGYRQWPFVVLGLVFVAIGTMLVRYRTQLSRFGPRRFTTTFSYFFLGFAILWTAIAFATTYGQYYVLRHAVKDGRISVVEGPVENFVPMPYSGHADESFSVKGVRFAYSDFNLTVGFNNTRSHGGPIEPGRYVRVSYVGADIVRLEVRR